MNNETRQLVEALERISVNLENIYDALTDFNETVDNVTGQCVNGNGFIAIRGAVDTYEQY